MIAPPDWTFTRTARFACVRAMSGTKATRECRTFATTTEGLEALLEWLNVSRCSVAAMEATGVYWLP
jgi:hypothetical protein